MNKCNATSMTQSKASKRWVTFGQPILPIVYRQNSAPHYEPHKNNTSNQYHNVNRLQHRPEQQK